MSLLIWFADVEKKYFTVSEWDLFPFPKDLEWEHLPKCAFQLIGMESWTLLAHTFHAEPQDFQFLFFKIK